jgi:hypothetical protein
VVGRWRPDDSQAVHQAFGRTANRISTMVEAPGLGIENAAAVDPSNGRVVSGWPLGVWMVVAPNTAVEGHLEENTI